MRTAETNFYKVASHLEEVGTQAVEEKFAHICDIIGNALADEAAELAAKLTKTIDQCLQAGGRWRTPKRSSFAFAWA